MLKGRFINDGDLADNGDWRASWTKAVINEEAARIMGIDNPIGKKISIWNYTIMQDGSRGRAEMEIVGIIQNFQAASLRNPSDRNRPKQMEQLFLLCPYRTRKRKSHDQSNPEYIQKTL